MQMLWLCHQAKCSSVIWVMKCGLLLSKTFKKNIEDVEISSEYRQWQNDCLMRMKTGWQFWFLELFIPLLINLLWEFPQVSKV